jgi:hypothetical protein
MQNTNKDTQSRKWQITINNPEKHGYSREFVKEILAKFKSLEYWCMADEVGEEGTPHTHLYMAFSSAARFSTIKKKFPKTHIEMARGTTKENREYIFKEGKWEKDRKRDGHKIETREEFGEMPIERPGARNDLADLLDMVKEGMTTHDIIEENPKFMMSGDKIERVRQMILEEKYKKTFRELTVTYVHGETGRGKTRDILEKYGYEKVYRITDYNHPFDKYNGQDVIMFDEFRNSLKMQEMLQYLEGYPLALPARYVNRQACYTKVYIVSNWDFHKQYTEIQKRDIDSWQAFERRIHKYIEYTKDDKIEIEILPEEWAN